MRKKKVLMMALAAMAATLLGGCGEAPYELTKEEESIIVNYSAHVLAKYNRYQKDGLTYVLEDAGTVEEAKTGESADEAEEPQDTEAETLPDTEAGTLPDGTEPVDSALVSTLQDVFGTENLKLDYVGSRIADSYTESDVYALNANPGKLYLIVGIDILNTSDAAVDFNILDAMPKFRATLNGTTTVDSEFTILAEDFSTFEGTIEAGETVETVLLFQIPDTEGAIESLGLNVSAGEDNYQIILESTEI